MAISEKKIMGLILPLHLLTIILLSIYVNSLGLVFILPVIVVCEAIILIYARDNAKLFLFMWQLPFFIVLFLALLVEPNRLLNIDKVPSLAPLLFMGALALMEAIMAAICFLGERAIKPILFGSTATMIAAVFLIVALIGSEGMMGMMENDPIEMLTSTSWSAHYDPDTEGHLYIPMVILQYDFDVSTNNSVVHVQPGVDAILSLIIINKGALGDRYSISVVAGPEVECRLSQDIVTVNGSSASEVPLILCSHTQGSFDVEVQVDGDNGGKRGVDIRLEASNAGIELDHEGEKTIKTGPEGSTGSFPFSVTNTGTEGCNITFVVTASDHFRPSIRGTSSWNYSLSEGYSYLGAGEVGNYSLIPRFLKLEGGIYNVRVDITINGTDVQEIYNLVFDYQSVRYAWSLNDWTLPLHPGTVMEWTVVVGADNRAPYTMLTSIPEGCSVTATVNGTEIPLTTEWNRIKLDNNGTAMVTLLVSASEELTGDSELTMGFRTTGSTQSFGMAGFLAGTAITVAFALLFAVPLALGSAIFLVEYAPGRLRKVIKPIMEILAGIPSVVYGLWGGLTLGPMLSTNLYPFVSSTLGSVIPFFHSESSYMSPSIFTASIVLSIMIFPIIMTLSYDAMYAVPSDLKDASLATGATKWQTIRRVVMVKARSGVIASVVLGMGRAIGETMAVLMIMGCTSRIPGSIFDSVGTMTSAIASQFGETYAYDTSRHGLFAIALILFLIVFVLNLVVLSVTREHGSRRTNFLFKRFKGVKKVIAAKLAKRGRYVDIRSMFKPSERNARFDKYAKWCLYACAAILMVIVAYIMGDVIIRGGSSLRLSYLLEAEFGSGTEGGGFLNAITGSLALVAIAIGLSAPIAVLAAIYSNEYANKNGLIIRMTSFATSTLASTPSIIYGGFGFMLFVLYLGLGFSLIAGGLTLALMAMPLIFMSATEGLKSVPGTFREASYALGVSKWATIKNVILPVSFSSISSGVIIAIGRTIGETAAIILTAGYAAMLTDSLFMSAASLPNMIYKYFNYSFLHPEVGEKLYAAAFVLIMIIIVLNLAARLIASRSQKHMGIDLGNKSW
mgnify:CR=1 FL=1